MGESHEDEESGSGLESEALKRRERLRALREGRSASDHAVAPKSHDKLPRPKFRSYRPSDDVLKEAALEAAKPGDVEAQVQQQLEAAHARVQLDHLDVTTLAPRKPDWDLKRDIADKLDKLERRTQRAMAQLIRDRLNAADDQPPDNNHQ